MNAARTHTSVSLQYPLVRAAGSHRELGRQHGEQAADKIHAHLEKIAAERLRGEASALPPPGLHKEGNT